MTAKATFQRLGLFASIAALLLLPSFLWGPGNSDSAKYNFVWVSQFGQEMARGELYPRWLPGSFEGLGSPTFYFYPPLAYLIGGCLNALGLSVLTAINLTAFVGLFLSGVTMHHWLSMRGTSPKLGAILYMAAPYHLMDFYIRGALAEFFAFLWLPLVAAGIQRVAERRGIALLALSYAGLILTHLPVAMLAAFFLMTPLAVPLLWKDRKLLAPFAAAAALAIALSAFYLLGALTLQGSISAELFRTPWYRASSWALLAPGTLLTDIVIPLLATGLGLLSWRSRSIWTVITIITAVSALGLIPYMWDIEPLAAAQFPWRLLCIVEFAGLTALLTIQNKWTASVRVGATIILFCYALWLPRMAALLFEPVSYARFSRVLPDAPEYLPAGFTEPVDEDGRETDLGKWRRLPPGDMIVVRHPATITMRRAAFPIWYVTRDGSEIPSRGPFIQFDAEPGIYRIERRMIWQEIVGTFISLTSALLAVFLLLSRMGSTGLHWPARGGIPAGFRRGAARG